MLYHLSFNAHDPGRVARVLAKILDAIVVAAPSPPFNKGALFVCCGDDRGTMISLEPWGITYAPGPGAYTEMPHAESAPERNGFHALFMAKLPEEHIHEIVRHEGWPSGRCDNGQFEVINVWLEGRQLVEFTTPELLPAYLRIFGPEGMPGLDALLRAEEVRFREGIARTR